MPTFFGTAFGIYVNIKFITMKNDKSQGSKGRSSSDTKKSGSDSSTKKSQSTTGADQGQRDTTKSKRDLDQE